ncbi:hypothetical protein J6A34_01935 [bacterium]|nr:hypothetical protein [bacterium]
MMNGVNGLTPVYVLPLRDVEMCDKCMQDKMACNESHTQNLEDEKVDPSLYSKIMRNLALASMMLGNRSNLTQMNTNNMNQQMLEQQQMLTNMLMHQQAMQDHMTAVQMTTPGMGFI